MGVSFGFTRLFQQCDKVGPYWVSVMVVACIGKTHLLIGFNLISGRRKIGKWSTPGVFIEQLLDQDKNSFLQHMK